MGALPKRRISTGRSGRRRKDLALKASGKKYVSSRDRKAAKRGTASEA